MQTWALSTNVSVTFLESWLLVTLSPSQLITGRCEGGGMGPPPDPARKHSGLSWGGGGGWGVA